MLWKIIMNLAERGNQVTRLEKRREELEKARKRYEEWGNKVRALEKKYQEEEKTTVHDIVTEAELTPEQLAQLIRLAKLGKLSLGTFEKFGGYEDEN